MADDNLQDASAADRGATSARGKRVKLGDMVADGMYVSAAAARLALKNRILVDILARGEDFDVEAFMPDARETLLILAAEAEDDAVRTRAEGKRATGRWTDSDGTHDYRSRDVKNLRRRRTQSERVAAALRIRADDDDELRRLVEEAREAAWDEVARNIDRRLSIEAARPDLDPDYDVLRDARMQALRLVDLPRLSAHRRAQARVAKTE